MQTHLAAAPVAYTGRELRSHWILDAFGLKGDACVAFRGPCRVELAEMVDKADVARGVGIAAREMLHLICECFDPDLPRAVLRQRLLVATAGEHLRAVPGLRRDGDDLYVGERKLSVSIATVSPISSLIHFALNIDPAGAPVPAVGLTELGVDPESLAESLLEAFATELAGIEAARCKVRAVP